MKFTTSLSALAVVLPLIAQVHAMSVKVPEGLLVARAQQNNKFGGKGNTNKGNQGANTNKGTQTGNNNNNKGAQSSSAAVTTAAVTGSVTNTGAAAATSTAASGSNNNNNAANNNNDPQTSLTLDPNVIATGFEENGQQTPTAGQIASATSNNNFINFCLTVGNLPITNGKQITTGSCNPAPMGVLPSTSNMPSAKFQNPPNFGTIAANQAFTVTLNTANIELGNFVNAQANYFAGPQTVNGQGNIVGHTHVVIEQLQSLTQTTPTSPGDFAFFKGVDDAGTGGTVTVPVSAGVPPGAYRICSINTSANHVPVAVPVAQHGALDDCSYFTASVGGASASNSTAAANNGAANSAAGNANTGAAASNSGAAANTGAAANSGAAANTGAAANNSGAAAKSTGTASNTGAKSTANNGAAAKSTSSNTGAKSTANNNNGAAAKSTANNNNSQASQAAAQAASNQAAQAAAAQKAAQSKNQAAASQKAKGKRGFQFSGRSGLRAARH